MKNTLLKKLDDLEGDEIIKGYKGVLVFESLVEQLDRDTTWETFLSEAEEALEKKMAKDELASDVPEEDKFKKYVPVYTVSGAKRKYLERKAKVKLTGWLNVEPGNYPETVFAIQVKSPALVPKYKLNDWIILDSSFRQKETIGKIVLYHHPDLQAEYDDGFILREFSIEEIDNTGELFNDIKVILSPLNNAFPKKEISGISAGTQISIIGVEYEAKKEPWIIAFPGKDDYYKSCLPLTTMKTAAGYWSQEQYDIEDNPDWAEQWVKPKNISGPWEKGTFIAQVIGDSMEPKVPNGSWCVFTPSKAGSREGRIVLVWHAGITDQETGGSYTLKKYHSEKIAKEDQDWVHQKIVLQPLNPKFDPIELFPADENHVRIIAELDTVL
ncbi:MAG: S24 family peptidase [Spirochaetales bacterium]|nr:S24 family peptidase [Spirochaetales bacterium]